MQGKKFDWYLIAILICGAVLRLVLLGEKPPHFDEGINGWFVQELIALGYYDYDPTNYHGPLHFYILLVSQFIFGKGILALRIPTVLFGVGCIYLLARFDKYVGKMAAYIAAALFAISPAAVFYSRYSIHEIELTFFSLVAAHGFLRLWGKGDLRSLIILATGVVGMLATKETFLIHVLVWGIALGCLHLYQKFSPSHKLLQGSKLQVSSLQVWTTLGVSSLVVVALFSGFFQNFSGVGDFLYSLVPWLKTGFEGGHSKPFYYWLDLMRVYEYGALLGFVGLFYLLLPASFSVRLMGVYGFGVFLVYSLIPYKTPWCVLQVIWPFFLVIGYLVQQAHGRPRLVLLMLLGFCFPAMAAKSISLNFFRYTNPKEPYVYVQTHKDIMVLSDYMDQVVEQNPEFKHKPLTISLESTWPLPWMWSHYSQAVWLDEIPPNPDSWAIFIDQDKKMLLESKLKKEYFVFEFELRDSQKPSLAYLDRETFQFILGTPQGRFLASEKDYQIFKPKKLSIPSKGKGLKGQFFTDPYWKGDAIHREHFKNLQLSWQEGQSPLPSPFGIIFSGEIYIPQKGSYEFQLTSDDGSDLEIDGKTIITNLGAHETLSKTGRGYFLPGWKKIKVRYNDFGGGKTLMLKWKKGKNDWTLIGENSLRYSGG